MPIISPLLLGSVSLSFGNSTRQWEIQKFLLYVPVVPPSYVCCFIATINDRYAVSINPIFRLVTNQLVFRYVHNIIFQDCPTRSKVSIQTCHIRGRPLSSFGWQDRTWARALGVLGLWCPTSQDDLMRYLMRWLRFALICCFRFAPYISPYFWQGHQNLGGCLNPHKVWFWFAMTKGSKTKECREQKVEIDQRVHINAKLVGAIFINLRCHDRHIFPFSPRSAKIICEEIVDPIDWSIWRRSIQADSEYSQVVFIDV